MRKRRPHRLNLCDEGNAIAGPTRGRRSASGGWSSGRRDKLVGTLYWQLGSHDLCSA